MHESLKRPLFRKKAMEVYQAKQGGKVPGYVAGAFITPLMAGVRAAGPFIARQFARPTVQKGLLGLEAGTATAGLEETRRGFAGEESIFGDQRASILGGLATLAYPGIGAFGRTLPKAFPGSVRAAGAGEAITKKTPFLLPTTLIGIPAGLTESQIRGAVKDEKETRVDDPKKIEGLLTQLNQLGEGASYGQVFDVVQNYDLTQKQKDKVFTDVLKFTPEQIKILKQQPSEVVSQKQETEKSGDITPDNVVQKNMLSVTENINPNNLAPDEQAKLALKNVDKTNKANKEIKDLEEKNKDNDKFKTQFSILKNQVQSATGNSDMTNLVLLKLASGLLTGKTTQRGVGGFLDVLGQAAGPTVDVAIALANNQKDFDQKLALALIDSNAKKQSGLQAESKRVYVQEFNPADELFPVVTRLIPQNKDTGALLDVKMTDQGEQFVPYTGAGKMIEPDIKGKNASDRSMRDLSVGLEFAQIVKQAPLSAIGPEGSVREFLDRFSGSAKSYQSTLGDVDEFEMKSFNQIADAIMNEEQYVKSSADDIESHKKDSAKLLDKFKKESQSALDKVNKELDSGNEERIARAKLGLIEQRMKYIVANANKAQDRLTAKDVENAEKRTKILELFANPDQIKKNYDALYLEMNSNFRKQARAYVASGGLPDYVTGMYPMVPVVQDYQLKKNRGETKTKIKKDVNEILGTI
jgi:hypothetical protein